MQDWLTFVETTAFTKRLAALGLEESLRELQLALLENPEAGDVEPGTGGLRKVRLGDPTRGKGKRGEHADGRTTTRIASRRGTHQADRVNVDKGDGQ